MHCVRHRKTMSPSKQRRLQRHRAAAADLGMSLDQWRAHRAAESEARPKRQRILWRAQREYNQRERAARFASGTATTGDVLVQHAEAFLSALSSQMERYFLTGRSA